MDLALLTRWIAARVCVAALVWAGGCSAVLDDGELQAERLDADALGTDDPDVDTVSTIPTDTVVVSDTTPPTDADDAGDTAASTDAGDIGPPPIVIRHAGDGDQGCTLAFTKEGLGGGLFDCGTCPGEGSAWSLRFEVDAALGDTFAWELDEVSGAFMLPVTSYTGPSITVAAELECRGVLDEADHGGFRATVTVDGARSASVAFDASVIEVSSCPAANLCPDPAPQ